MKKSIIVWIFLFAIALSTALQAGPRAKPFTGTITYNIKVSGNLPPELESMLPNKAVYSIDEQFAKIDMTPSMMGTGSIIMNHEKQTMRMKLDIPGSKYQLIMDDQLKEQAAKAKNITYTTETRSIAGYECKKALVTGNEGEQIEVWFTEKIQVKNLDKMWGSLKGFPLEFSNSLQGITMVYTATEVKPGKIEKSEFEIDPQYKAVTGDQLDAIIGGMMGGE